MTFAKFLQPDLVLGETIVHLTPALLEKHQLRGLVLDVDETLVPLRERKVSPEVAAWITEVKQVVSLWLVSNNISETRIGGIAASLDVPYIFGARKPSRRKLRQAIDQMGFPVEQVGMVGDRLFTDALAGNRLGMFTILVEPMIDPAIAAQSYPIRNAEVWLTQVLGISIKR
ncbi:YqeG family HAD IIIA-type phosphatase [Spirulina sp. CS-785/01]|uniref:YqeG family HAD IIIA-type phosphatase n=1 Tax=Spirulina sp. CS-785/01 TaxID=3021716 RepID=UPI00232DA33F|nr:YqeG family HAD IIIA-type phosphatase [Spirulina sp. CS-785/01]MDB9312728.1 YqeG family HAD IIIA-type phosphatase [Spirulina sp. CS-785/01]